MSVEKEKNFNNIYTFEPIVRSKSKKVIEGLSDNFIDRLKDYQTKKSNNIKKIKSEVENGIPKPKKVTLTRSNSFSGNNMADGNLQEFHKRKQDKII